MRPTGPSLTRRPNQHKALHVKAAFDAELGQSRHIAAPLVTKVKVGTDHDSSGPQTVDQHATDEMVGVLLAALLIEMHDHNGVDARSCEQLKSLFERAQQRRRRFRPDDRCRVPIEGHHNRLAALSGSIGPQLPNQRTVAHMDAIKEANGDNRLEPRPGLIVEKFSLAEDAHRHRVGCTSMQDPSAADTWPPPSWEADAVLSDGGTVHIRPIRPEDAALISEFHARQSAESIYFRYFTARPTLSQRDLNYLTQVDHRSRVAFIALSDDVMLGVARYERLRGTRTAEVAFFVDDEHQRRGLAGTLLEWLAAAAREVGLDQFMASVLPANRRMLAVFESAGYQLDRKTEDGVVEVHFDIEPNEAAVQTLLARDAKAHAAAVRKLVNPEGIAVIGAGSQPGNLGHEILRNLIWHRVAAPVYAVNRSRPVVSGVPTYRAVADIDGEVDVAIIAVSADQVAGVADECGQAGVEALIVLTGSFAESGRDGAVREAELLEVVRRYGMRMLGPNSLGLINTAAATSMHATPVRAHPRTGPIGLVAQSGTLGAALIDRATDINMGVSTVFAVGNHADLDLADFLQYWADDDQTTAALVYAESFEPLDRFVRAAQAICPNKPVAAMWTAPPTGPDPVTRALFRQTGVIRVSSLRQLFNVGRMVESQPIPAGSTIAIVANSDGAASLTANQCRLADMIITDGAGGSAPIVMPWHASPDDYQAQITAIIEAPAERRPDSLIVLYAHPQLESDPLMADAIAHAVASAEGICVAAVLLDGQTQYLDVGSGKVPVFVFPEDAVASIGRLAGWQAWRSRRAAQSQFRKVWERTAQATPIARPDPPDPDRAGDAIHRIWTAHGPGKLHLEDSLIIAREARLPMVPTIVAPDRAAVDESVSTLGYPVVLKSATRTRTSRSEMTGVALDVHADPELDDVCARWAERWGGREYPMVVQRMATTTTDLMILGRRTLRACTVSVGLGGHLSGLTDNQLMIVPFGMDDIIEIANRLPISDDIRESDGFRQLMQLVLSVGTMMERHDTLQRLELNPVGVSSDLAVITDIVIELAEPTAAALTIRQR